MNDILLNAALKEAISKKGTKYICIEIEIKPGYVVKYFPDNAEQEIIKMYYSGKSNK